LHDFECPYCGAELNEPDECNEPDQTYEHECRECGKAFIFTVDYIKTFDSRQADCLNGKPHDYQPIVHAAPEWFFKGKRRCSMCGKQIEIEPAIPPTNG
jgi:hypothetical protein